MKNLSKLKLLTLIITTSIFMSNCSFKKSIIDLNEPNQTSVLKPTVIIGKKVACPCEKEVQGTCPVCITDFLMLMHKEQKYEIHWDLCESSDNESVGCHDFAPKANPIITTAKFCYSKSTGSDCLINLQLDNLPNCIDCIAQGFYPYCIGLVAKCSSTNGNDYTVTLGDNDPNTPDIITYTYSIKKDEAKIRLCCTKLNPVTGFMYNYCCSGYMVPIY